jgi:hypothetical protein
MRRTSSEKTSRWATEATRRGATKWKHELVRGENAESGTSFCGVWRCLMLYRIDKDEWSVM